MCCIHASTEADFFFLHQNKRMPLSIDREKMFVDLSPVKRCLCWLSPLVSRLHLAQPNQNTNTPLSFGCSPSHPVSIPLCQSVSYYPTLHIKFYILTSVLFFLSPLLHVCLSLYVRQEEYHTILLSSPALFHPPSPLIFFLPFISLLSNLLI